MGIFDRNVKGTTEILAGKTIGIAGCGGLGSNAAVSLVRAGIGSLIIADFDSVEESNLNRQHFFQSDIGKPKAEALAAYLKAINPDLNLTVHNIRLDPGNIPAVFKGADLLIEAFDKAEAKVFLIESWCAAYPDKPIVCASGLAGIGHLRSLKVRCTGNIYIVGDGTSDMTIGLNSARVAIAANMEASVAIELLLGKEVETELFRSEFSRRS